MKFFIIILFFVLSLNSPAHAGVGLSVASGIPFLGQGGVDIKTSDRFSYYIGYNLLDLSVGTSTAKLSMPEVLFRYHIFKEALYIGLGAGYQTLEASATDTLTSNTAKIEVSGLTGVVKLGWMWGASDNDGLWFGVDAAYIVPLSSEETITAPGVPTTAQIYIDAQDAADQYGKTAYPNITFARLGYFF